MAEGWPGAVVAVVPIAAPYAAAALPLGTGSVLEQTVRSLQASEAVGSVVLAVEGDGADAILAAFRRTGASGAPALVQADARWTAIREALAVAGGAQVVVIHEANRPLLAPRELPRLLSEWDGRAALVAAHPVAGSIKRVRDGRVMATVSRDTLRAVQGPWILPRSTLEGLLAAAIREARAPDSMLGLVLHANHTVQVADADPYNVPIVTRADARFAEMALQGGFGATEGAVGR